MPRFAKLMTIARLPYFAPKMHRQVLTVRITEKERLSPSTRLSICRSIAKPVMLPYTAPIRQTDRLYTPINVTVVTSVESTLR